MRWQALTGELEHELFLRLVARGLRAAGRLLLLHLRLDLFHVELDWFDCVCFRRRGLFLSELAQPRLGVARHQEEGREGEHDPHRSLHDSEGSPCTTRDPRALGGFALHDSGTVSVELLSAHPAAIVRGSRRQKYRHSLPQSAWSRTRMRTEP